MPTNSAPCIFFCQKVRCGARAACWISQRAHPATHRADAASAGRREGRRAALRRSHGSASLDGSFHTSPRFHTSHARIRSPTRIGVGNDATRGVATASASQPRRRAMLYTVIAIVIAIALLFAWLLKPQPPCHSHVPSKTVDWTKRRTLSEAVAAEAPKTGLTYLVVGTGSVGLALINALLERGEKNVRGFDVREPRRSPSSSAFTSSAAASATSTRSLRRARAPTSSSRRSR